MTPPPYGHHRRAGARGFSLVELMAVLTILAVLASIGLPLAQVAQRRAQEEELRQALRDIRGALDRYKELVDQGRIERAADASGWPPTLEVLVQGVPDVQSGNGSRIYLLRRLPRDPFSHQTALEPARQWTPRSYESAPDDPRPGNDVFDVHSASDEQALDGSYYRNW